MKKIIYPQETGIAVIHPTGDWPIEETAVKDVPSGVKYKIIDHTDLPEDRDFRGAWEFDFDKHEEPAFNFSIEGADPPEDDEDDEDENLDDQDEDDDNLSEPPSARVW